MSRPTSAVRSKPGDARLPSAEARLLGQINRGMTEEWWGRYHDLVAKRQEYRLNGAEHRELIRLTDVLEERETKRLRALVKLATLRQQTLSELMASLDLLGKTDA